MVLTINSGGNKMKRIIISITILILVLAFGLANARDYEMTKKAGDYTVQIKIDKNPPVTGINKIDIAIKDAAGKTVTDAAVAVDYGMPAMPGMGAMNYKTTATLKGESYLATANFSMAGPWFVNIKISRSGKTQTVKLNVDVK
jgi:hypothetical protein